MWRHPYHHIELSTARTTLVLGAEHYYQPFSLSVSVNLKILKIKKIAMTMLKRLSMSRSKWKIIEATNDWLLTGAYSHVVFSLDFMLINNKLNFQNSTPASRSLLGYVTFQTALLVRFAVIYSAFVYSARSFHAVETKL